MKIFWGHQLSGKFWGCTWQLDLTRGLAKPIFKPFPRNELEKVKFPSFILKPSVVLIVGTSGFLLEPHFYKADPWKQPVLDVSFFDLNFKFFCLSQVSPCEV